MRNLLAGLGTFCVLVGCGTAVQDNGWGVVLSRFQGTEQSSRFTAAVEADAPTLQIGFVDAGASANLRLERRDGPFEYWLSADGVHLVLEDGMLHSTRGLGEGLLASELSEPLRRLQTLQEGPSDRFHTYLNGNDEAVTRTYRCDFRQTREITIAVVGGEIPTVLFRESCNSLDQEFENLYWVDPQTRQIVQSRQWAGPLVAAISTRIVLE